VLTIRITTNATNIAEFLAAALGNENLPLKFFNEL